MRESAVRGPAVDFEEFERRLRVGAGRPNERSAETAESAAAEKVDPLEELARIIRSGRVGAPLSGGDRAPSPDVAADRVERAPPAVAPPARWPEPSLEEVRYSDPGTLRGTYPTAQDAAAEYSEDQHYYDDPAQNPGVYAHPEEYPQTGADLYDVERQPGDYADYGAPSYGEAETGWPETEADGYEYATEPQEQPAAAPSRRLPDFAGKLKPWHAVAAIAVLAVVSVGWAVAHRMGGRASHEIALIPPPEGPLKIKPSAETGGETPSPGGTAVLDRKEGTPVRQIVTSQEQAVDPSVPQDVLQIGSGPVEAPHEPPPSSVTQPRKVRTVAVRPEAPPAVQPSAPAPETSVKPEAPAPAAPPSARPAARTASTAAAAPAAPGGGFAVQFGAAGSESEARALIKTIGEKYGAMLGGRKLSFKAATVGEKKVFRVRIAGLAKDAAEALCGRVKASGGACFVAGN